MDWFTGDTHFSHDAIRRHSNRPFSTTEEMDQALLHNINSCVDRRDTLYHLGDFAWRDIAGYRKKIKCKNIYLILGNHDRHSKTGQPDKEYFKLFSGVYLLYRYKNPILPNRIVLCHYPMRSWQNSVHGSWQFHGHTHGLVSVKRRIDVGVDAQDYMPISIDTIIEKYIEPYDTSWEDYEDD